MSVVGMMTADNDNTFDYYLCDNDKVRLSARGRFCQNLSVDD